MSKIKKNEYIKCGRSTKHFISLKQTQCQGQQQCHRSYVLYLPTVICDSYDQNSATAATAVAPLFYAVHCYGCTAAAMMHYTKEAEEHGFVLVIPEGIDRGFNAKVCCGTPMEKHVDDVGFFRELKQTLFENEVYGHHISRNAVYAVGWSNGGYMVTYAAKLFRAIAAVSGYQYDGWDQLSPDHPVGLFLHHAVNDTLVRFAGCCTDESMPGCCCQISQNSPQTCQSATDFADIWAQTVNHCGDGDDDNANEGNMSTMSKLEPPRVSLLDRSRNITCKTYTGCSSSDVSPNTTVCVHQDGAHFNSPDHGTAFPMKGEILGFFARDACQMSSQNQWDESTQTCHCDRGGFGQYCLDTPIIREFGSILPYRMGIVAVVLTVVVYLGFRRYKSRLNKLSAFDKPPPSLELVAVEK